MATLTMVSRRNERGQAVIEMALTLPLLLLVVFGIFDFGFMFQRYEVVTNAAREGARLAVLPGSQGYTAADVRSRTLSYLQAGGVDVSNPRTAVKCAGGIVNGSICVDVVTSTVTITGSSPAKTVDQVMVVVAYDHQHVFVGPIMNLFGGTLGTVRLYGVSMMRRE